MFWWERKNKVNASYGRLRGCVRKSFKFDRTHLIKFSRLVLCYRADLCMLAFLGLYKNMVSLQSSPVMHDQTYCLTILIRWTLLLIMQASFLDISTGSPWIAWHTSICFSNSSMAWANNEFTKTVFGLHLMLIVYPVKRAKIYINGQINWADGRYKVNIWRMDLILLLQE